MIVLLFYNLPIIMIRDFDDRQQLEVIFKATIDNGIVHFLCHSQGKVAR